MTNYHDKFAQITAEIADATKDGRAYTYEGRVYYTADRAARIALVSAVSADYNRAHAEFNQRALERWVSGGCRGERPSPVSVDTALLGRLADAILYEELTDTYRDKTNVEYPFLSERQFARRYNGETAVKAAEEYGTDGRNYALPKRRKRREHEHGYVDRYARSRNKARAAQYRKDTAAGRVVTYNLRDTGGALAEEFTACQGVGEWWKDGLSSVYV
ncbi:hypothetical protein [Paenibacillus elgii]|uniref:hypothetical protein n=1 Tax=Paenibacillus elgii TaxID=189691 RepID=UPI000248C2FB|nr:hypothetical protein [Paenibacillus elgii]